MLTSLTALNAKEYFSSVIAAFECAVKATSDIRRYYRLGPGVLCLRYAGEALVTPLSTAFSHLEIAPCLPSLMIHCWDSISTETPMPPPPWPSTAYGARGHIIGYNDEVIRTVYQPGNDILQMYNSIEHTGIYWMQHLHLLPYWEKSFPMRNLIHWWSKSQPLQLVHAAAVGTNKGGVLLTGKSGSGKSTTALTCLNSPLQYAGDDYVMISNKPDPFVYSLYNSAKLVFDKVGVLPYMEGKLSNPNALSGEKALFFLHQHYPKKLNTGFPIKAIFLPRVTNKSKTALRPATAAEALFALAPTTVLHLEGDSKNAFDKMGHFVKSAATFWIDLGSDLEEIPHVINEFLESSYD